jgi:hypothetical protein
MAHPHVIVTDLDILTGGKNLPAKPAPHPKFRLIREALRARILRLRLRMTMWGGNSGVMTRKHKGEE